MSAIKLLGKGSVFVGDMSELVVDAVHAALAGDAAANAFPGPITDPSQPRILSATAEASYDGGALTIVGTDINGNDLTEVITPVPGSTVYGTSIFATVASITKAAVGVSSDTVSVGVGRITSKPLKVYDYTIVGLTFVWTGADNPSGTIAIEYSNDYDPARPDNGATWFTMTLSGSFTQPPGSGAGSTSQSLVRLPWEYVRVVYTPTADGDADRLTVHASVRRY